MSATTETIAAKARAIATKAKTENRNLTPEETTQVHNLVTELKRAQSQDFLDQFQSPADHSSKKTGDFYLDRSPAALKSKSDEVVARMQRKELITGARTQLTVPLSIAPVMLPGQNAYTLSQLIIHEAVSKPDYRYLRQTKRVNNAAVVKPGDTKPTSEYAFEEVVGSLKVIAHLSEPFHKYWATDMPEAVTALTTEMVNGIFNKEEDLILNGPGTAGTPAGILNTAGIQTQAFDTDLLTTTRAAITKLELLDLAPGAFVLNPVDWQTLELSRNTSGQLEYSSGPIDRAEHRLWGVPVATSTRIPVGTGVLIDLTSVRVITDNEMSIEARDTVGDDFERNNIRLRAEQRFDIKVTRPEGVVKFEG